METAPQYEASTETTPNDVAAETSPASDSLADAAASGTLPVPVSEPVRKESLWRRMTQRGGSRKASEASTQQDLVKSRLDGITLRLESIENSLARGDERLDERLARLWEIEEQLESLQDLGERATEARDAALEAANAAQRASTVASIAAVLSGLAVLVTAASIALPGLAL